MMNIRELSSRPCWRARPRRASRGAQLVPAFGLRAADQNRTDDLRITSQMMFVHVRPPMGGCPANGPSGRRAIPGHPRSSRPIVASALARSVKRVPQRSQRGRCQPGGTAAVLQTYHTGALTSADARRGGHVQATDPARAGVARLSQEGQRRFNRSYAYEHAASLARL